MKGRTINVTTFSGKKDLDKRRYVKAYPLFVKYILKKKLWLETIGTSETYFFLFKHNELKDCLGSDQ